MPSAMGHSVERFRKEYSTPLARCGRTDRRLRLPLFFSDV
uniref:Uncharacterized protein n=1 Tax=Anguilla anguilla TaxID=7936 RepID=A0A0E9SJP3_ANGAN